MQPIGNGAGQNAGQANARAGGNAQAAGNGMTQEQQALLGKLFQDVLNRMMDQATENANSGA
ncbi:hypothetical protein CSC94_14470 [Zhengella mangrovi]|uniref:Uncharacterized protein n=1 Tax=Zhengella mangrovi TaxID=1982044 RepID=A0A2G1QLY2_9HYPH|nr:hypothetical protein [Zhengella mangrovi]PHP66479.1 hypothetical protein CSC94_14470 [Zhengella mangrovi]